MAVSDWAGSVCDWRYTLREFNAYLAPAFRRAEQRLSAGAFLDGLLSSVERKTGWMLSEAAGFEKPYRIQSLLGRSRWSAEKLCERVRSYALDALRDEGGVLVVDETGFLKKGTQSVGVARQYSGTAGRVENSQIGVFASYASRWGHALIDRRLYLPKAWAEDPSRRAKANVPQDIVFATKPALATEMVANLLDEGLPCAFVLADAVYGTDIRFRRMLENRAKPYILAVKSNHTLRSLEEYGLVQTNPKTMVSELLPEAWVLLSAGEGTKGHRLYDWARIQLGRENENGFSRWLVARRSPRAPEVITYYFAYAHSNTSLQDISAGAGLRWTIEECFLRAKDDIGLDHCEARSWHGWHRHMTLVMAAAAFLTMLSANQRQRAFAKVNKTSPPEQTAAA
jgi:SRSO17 transposase